MIILKQMLQRSINRTFGRKKSTRCEEPDCNGEPMYPKKPQKYVIEKNCCPSIFDQWKPKIPELNTCLFPKLDNICCKPKKKCHAGMKFHEKSISQIKQEGKECLKQNNLKFMKTPTLPKAIKEEKMSGQFCKKSTSNVAIAIKKSMRKKCQQKIPTGDWDIDGTL